MELTLQRIWAGTASTCGELTCNGSKFYTLELPVRDGLPGSAIPTGRYPIELAPSPKFLATGEHDPWVEIYAGQMPHVVQIPGRSLIMIHWGNTPHDTDGCILVGLHHDLDQVGESRKAFEQLFDLIGESARAGDCWITVKDAPTTDLSMQGDV